MSRYILSPEAGVDLKEINRYLTQNNPAAAGRLREKIKQQCKRLADFPNMGRRWDEINPPLRSFPVESYLIFYRPIDGGIEVVRVVSGYRDLKTIFHLQNEGEQ